MKVSAAKREVIPSVPPFLVLLSFGQRETIVRSLYKYVTCFVVVIVNLTFIRKHFPLCQVIDFCPGAKIL